MVQEGAPRPEFQPEAEERAPLLSSSPHAAPRDETPVASELKEVSNGRLALVMGSLWIGVVFTALDSTIVATLLIPMSNSFSSFETLSWLGSAYLIASAAAQPLAGRLTDIFGRREGAVVCNILFALGTLLCGLANAEWVLIFGRVVAGMGGGALNTVSTVVGSDLVPLRKRGVVQGINNIAMGAAGAVGGLFGGWIDGLLGWKWAFWIQVPFILFGAAMCYFVVDVPIEKSGTPAIRRVDWLGAGTLVATLVLLLFGLNSGGNLAAWSSPLVLTTLSLSAVLLAIFIYIEESVAEPIIPLRLMLNRTVAAACSTYFFAFMASFGMIFYIPIYLQVLGATPTEAGLRFIPQSAGTAVGALGAGILIRAIGSYRYLNLAIHCLLVSTSVGLTTLTIHSPKWPPFLFLGLAGLGFGGMLVATLIALISSAEHSQQALLTAASFAFRSTGSTVGVTACSALFQNKLRAELWKRIGNTENAANIISRILKSFDEFYSVDKALVAPIQESYMAALHDVYWLITAFSVLAAVSAICMRQNVLHSNVSRK